MGVLFMSLTWVSDLCLLIYVHSDLCLIYVRVLTWVSDLGSGLNMGV
jgi:hypothetical protein